MCIYIFSIYIHVITREKRDHDFEKEQGGVYGRVRRKGKGRKKTEQKEKMM